MNRLQIKSILAPSKQSGRFMASTQLNLAEENFTAG